VALSKIQIVRNEDVSRVLVGVPRGHKHLRIFIQLENGSALIFHEATVANMIRAYITVKTHPSARAQELEAQTLTPEQRKEDFAQHQLVETPTVSRAIEVELEELLEESTASTSSL
jgi:hypothetical protein